MSIHIKSFQVQTESGTLFADLQLAKADNGDCSLRLRLSRRARKLEHFLGFSGLNKACEMVKYPEEISDKERDMIEAQIREALG